MRVVLLDHVAPLRSYS